MLVVSQGVEMNLINLETKKSFFCISALPLASVKRKWVLSDDTKAKKKIVRVLIELCRFLLPLVF